MLRAGRAGQAGRAQHLPTLLYTNPGTLRASLEESLNTRENNLKLLTSHRAEILSRLRDRLYDKQKTRLTYCRHSFPDAAELAEVDKSIEIAQQKLNDFQATKPHALQELRRRRDYFRDKLDSLDEIIRGIQQLETIVQEIRETKEKTYEMYQAERKTILANVTCSCQTCPDGECACDENVLRALDDKWSFFLAECEKESSSHDAKLDEAKKCLVTFLCVNPGGTRVMHTDDVGAFYIDEYGRKIYSGSSGMDLYCLGCDGQLEKFREEFDYFDDTVGRYTSNTGNTGNTGKLYQRAVCASLYELHAQDYLTKVTEDCGHSDKHNAMCCKLLRGSSDIVHTRECQHVSIDGALSAADCAYLWESVGAAMYRGLYALATLRPRSPLHRLAHRLLFDKYEATKEHEACKDTAGQYRHRVLADRLAEKVKASAAWKSRQVKRATPEDLDDSYDQHVEHSCVQRQQLACVHLSSLQ